MPGGIIAHVTGAIILLNPEDGSPVVPKLSGTVTGMSSGPTSVSSASLLSFDGDTFAESMLPGMQLHVAEGGRTEKSANFFRIV
jgi:hypothetical protein